MAKEKVDHGLLQDDKLLIIENGQVRLGVNPALGGAVTYLAAPGGKNLINSFDWGRQVQMSFYSFPVPFCPEGHDMDESWRFIGWNPIQVGDAYGHHSQLLDSRCGENEIYVKCIPMHWPLDNYPGECTFETWYRLDGNKVLVTARINNARPDTTLYPARSQELPAVYTNGEWYKLVSYLGDKPFTGDEATVMYTKEGGEHWPPVSFCPTEHWAALVDDDGYGLGVYNRMTGHFSGGFCGEMGAGGPKDSPTGYISPFAEEILDHDIVFTYDYALIPGTVEEIRAAAAQLSADEVPGVWSFADSRDHFTYKGITDAGWPIRGCLDFDFDAEGELVSPIFRLAPGAAHTLLLDGAFTGGEIPVRVVVLQGVPHCHARDFAYDTLTADGTLSGDGERRIHALALPENDRATEGFRLVFCGKGHAKLYGLRLE